MAHPLDGAWLKIDRAREHLATLKDELPSVQVRPYKAVGAWEGDHYTIRWSVIEDGTFVPKRIGMIVADVIHNLRTAFDHVAWQLAGKSQYRGTSFPIIEKEKDYAYEATRALRGVHPDAADLVERLQPFHMRAIAEGREEPRDMSLNALTMILGRLDNVDKHTILLASHAVALFEAPAVTNVASGKLQPAGAWVPVVDGALLCSFTDLVPLDASRPIELEAEPQVTMVFGRPISLSDPSVWTDRHAGGMSVADLFAAADDTEKIVGLFVRFFD